ncbi:CPCC family cysteine-rich protein [Yersinia massiliensis]|nr:CPCC family cysteine-rich protein [Yersinia massiliensis]
MCPVCSWEDGPVQSSDPKYEGGANKMSLNSAKRAYRSSN